MERTIRGFEGMPAALEIQATMVASQTNHTVEKRFGVHSLVNTDGSISMDSFAVENGGPYTKKRIKDNEDSVQLLEYDFSGAKNEPDPAKQRAVVTKWKRERKEQKSHKAELATLILMHRILRDKFLVMRSAPIDDYKAGVDYILVNQETGESLCAFDGVAENDLARHRDEKARKDVKQEKIEKIFKQSGALIQYGFKLEKNKLVRTQLPGMPVFYVSLMDEDLNFLLSKANESIDSPVADREKNIFNKFIASLEEQYLALKKIPIRQGSDLERNFKAFKKTLEMLKAC